MVMLFFFFVRISFFVGIDTLYQATLESDENAKSQIDVASNEKRRTLK